MNLCDRLWQKRTTRGPEALQCRPKVNDNCRRNSRGNNYFDGSARRHGGCSHPSKHLPEHWQFTKRLCSDIGMPLLSTAAPLLAGFTGVSVLPAQSFDSL